MTDGLKKLVEFTSLNQRGNLSPKQGYGSPNFHVQGKFKEWLISAAASKLTGEDMAQAISEINTRDSGELMQEFIQSHSEEEEEEEDKEKPTLHPEAYVVDALKRLGYYRVRGTLWAAKRNGIEVVTKTSAIEIMLKSDLYNHNRVRNEYKPIGSEDMFDAWKKVCLLQSEKIDTDLRELIQYDAAYATGTVKWLGDCYDLLKIKQPLDIWLNVMMHFMWAVKRRVFKLTEKTPVKYPLWLAIQGAQGIGKDYVAEHMLFAPFEGRYIQASLSILDDFSREIAKFTDNYVINFNELSSGSDQKEDSGLERLSKGTVANLKALLTGDKLSTRKFHTQEQENSVRSVEFFSTANYHLYDIISDPSGMRRFFEFDSLQPKLVMFDNERVRELCEQSAAAWCGIDEGLDNGYYSPSSPIGVRVSEIQDGYRGVTSIHLWIDDNKIEVGNVCTTKTRAAYASYTKWCKASNVHAYGYPGFTNVLDLNGWADKKDSTCYLELT